MNLPTVHAADTRQDYPDGWAPGELPRPPRGPQGHTRWLIALGVLAAVVALCVGLVIANDARPAPPPGSNDTAARPAVPPGTVASARDTGPIQIITEDATCGDWEAVRTSLGAARKAGWDNRNPRVPVSAWTPDQKTQAKTVGDALRKGADTAVTLAVQTPHRAMRGLYEAFIVYGRAYSAALPTYKPADDYLAQTSMAASEAITHICAANESRATGSQQERLAPVAAPTTKPATSDPTKPNRFLPQPNRACARWSDDSAALQTRLRPWSALDPNVGVGRLTPDQVLVYADAARTVSQFADKMEAVGRASGNPVVEDFATLGALYFRAYSQAVSLIWAGAHDLIRAGFAVDDLVTAACSATAP